jgi:hypothetical protein
MKSFRDKLLQLPCGSFYITYNNSKYLTTKQTYSNNKIIKLYAKELKGNDIVSGNYFISIKNGLLKPCEMSEKKVIDFIMHGIQK